MTANPIALYAAIRVIKDKYPHANDLCRAVGVNPTADDGSVAQPWLLALRDSLIEDLDRIITADYPSDEIHDLESTPVSSYDQWQVWAELRLWEFDPDTAVMEAGEFTKPYPSFATESVRAVKFTDIPDLAQSYEYEIAGDALNIMLQDALQAYGEATEEDTEE